MLQYPLHFCRNLRLATMDIKKNSYLRYKRKDPNHVIDWVAEKAPEHIALAVDLSCVNFVEERHHHKSVENHCEVNSGWSSQV